MPTFTLFGNDKIVFRFFEPLETSHKDDRYVDSGVEIDGRKHTIGIGAGSPLFSARDNEVTRPIMNKCHEDKKSKDSTTNDKSEGESKDTPPSDKTEGDTPVTPVTPKILNSDEKTSVDSTTEPEAQTRVETEAERIQREGDEAMDGNGDGTGSTYS